MTGIEILLFTHYQHLSPFRASDADVDNSSLLNNWNMCHDGLFFDLDDFDLVVVIVELYG